MAAVAMCTRQMIRGFSHISGSVYKLYTPNIPRLNSKTYSTLNEENSKRKDEANSETPTSSTSNTTDSPNLNELLAIKEDLTGRISTLNDKYLRALAENENVRDRMTRQIAEAKQYGIQSFCKDLLDVADVLSKATESVPASELTDSNPHLKNLHEGLRMTEQQLHKVFRLHGLTQINPLGERFDPNMHEAMFELVAEGKPPGTVGVVTKVGYRLRDRTIRPAVVGVVKAS